MKSELKDLFQHMRWADEVVWEVVLNSEAATNDEKIRKLLYHIHIVQRAFNDAWLGVNPETAFPEFDNTVSLRGWADETLERVLGFVDTADDEILRGELKLPWAGLVESQIARPPAPVNLGQTALQVAMHSAYHRGQVNARLRELGVEPPLVDFIVWLWKGRPGN